MAQLLVFNRSLSRSFVVNGLPVAKLLPAIKQKAINKFCCADKQSNKKNCSCFFSAFLHTLKTKNSSYFSIECTMSGYEVQKRNSM